MVLTSPAFPAIRISLGRLAIYIYIYIYIYICMNIFKCASIFLNFTKRIPLMSLKEGGRHNGRIKKFLQSFIECVYVCWNGGGV